MTSETQLWVFPTIDVEGVHGDRPFEQMVLGQLGGAETWGVYRQAELFQRYGVQATFFVDVYEATLWGEAAWEQVCCRLVELGQDVQLHTHPSWRDDPRDPAWLRRYKARHSYGPPDRGDFMAKLAPADQREVVEWGCERLEKWIGRRPIAHRSGGYSINDGTLAALRHAGIAVDSSMLAGHPHSETAWAHNRIVERQGVVEVPITTMRYALWQRSQVRRLSAVLKTDVDACTADELRAYVAASLAGGGRVMNLFLHSYSLLEIDPLLRRVGPSPRKAAHLESFLQSVTARPEIQVVSCRQFYEQYRADPAPFDGADFIPTIAAPRTLFRLGLRKLQTRLRCAWSGISADRLPRGMSARTPGVAG